MNEASQREPSSTRTATHLVIAALALGLLWWLKSVVAPIALAILFTFLLTQPIAWLERRRVPRVFAVAMAVATACAITGGLAWSVGRQVSNLIDDFPVYQKHLDAKIISMRLGDKGIFDKLRSIESRVSSQIEAASKEKAAHGTEFGLGQPQEVTVVADPGPFHLGDLWRALSPALQWLATAGFVLVLSSFMLLKREDLRDRVIAVVGHGRLVATTTAFGEAGELISRYLLRQLIVNSAFGLTLGIGFALIGVPYSFLWGACAALLRYIPYIGSGLAVIMPIGLSLVLSDSWLPLVLVLGLFTVLELITNMFIEPRLYGRGVGVSETATLIMVAFWTWLWGPVGLVLATPLTVCVVVLGRHVPTLRPFSLLLGDQPALAPEVNFYQRLLAGDRNEALMIATRALHGATSPSLACDQLLVPALSYLRRDAERGILSESQENHALAVFQGVVSQVTEMSSIDAAITSGRRQAVVLAPIRDEAASAALGLFETAVLQDRFICLPVPAGLSASEAVQFAVDHPAIAVVIGLVSNEAVPAALLFCVRVRATGAPIPIIVAHLASTEGEQTRDKFLRSGADHVTTTFEETRALLESMRMPEPEPVAAPAAIELMSMTARAR